MVAPSRVTLPFEGARNPAIMWMRVDLPAPLGPSRPVTPGPIVMVTPLTATTLPYHRETTRSWRTLTGPPDRAPANRSLCARLPEPQVQDGQRAGHDGRAHEREHRTADAGRRRLRRRHLGPQRPDLDAVDEVERREHAGPAGDRELGLVLRDALDGADRGRADEVDRHHRGHAEAAAWG